MSDFLALLDKYRERPATPIHRYYLNRSSARATHVFYEGFHDPAIYSSAIKAVQPTGFLFHSYVCLGKRVVLEVASTIRDEHSTSNALMFFVDKDIDELVGGDIVPIDVFCTRYYSVECALADDEAFRRAWEEVLAQPAGAGEETIFVEKFNMARREFEDAMLEVMAWVIWHRRNGRRPNLNNIVLDDLVALQDDGRIDLLLSDTRLVERLDIFCGVITGELWYHDRVAIIAEIRTRDRREIVRGKFYLWFFVKVIALVRKWLSRANALPRGVMDFYPGNCLAVLGPRLRLPAECFVYFRSRFTSTAGSTTV